MSIPKCLDFNDFNRYPADENPTTDADMQNYMGNQNELMQNVVDALLWQPQTNYAVEHIIYSPNLPAGFCAVCKTGGRSGNTEPAWSKDVTAYTDGNVVWNITSMESGGHKIVNELPNLDDAKENVVYFVENDAEKTPDELNVGQAINNLENEVNALKVIETGADYVIAGGHSVDGTQWYRRWKSGWLEQGGKIDSSNITVNLLTPFANSNYFVISTINADTVATSTNSYPIWCHEKNNTSFKTYNYNSNVTANQYGVWYACGMGANE